MSLSQFRRKLGIAAIGMAALFATSCTMVTDEPTPCPAELNIRFVYDYNIKFADAFANEVKSVNVWAFRPDGSLAWSGSASGEELSRDGFVMHTPLTEGEYDFVSWCGLEDNGSFDLATYTPASKEELEVTLKTLEEEGLNVSKDRLPGLFHGQIHKVKYEIDPYAPSYKTVTIPLMKDTKDIRIMLQHLDGSPIENRQFTVTITNADKFLGWNNSVLPSPTVTYKPWNIKYGQTTPPRENTRTETTVASLLFEMSTSRLMENSDCVLTVHRQWDDRDIIRINLISYLLFVKGHYGDITDQEYLDRQDDYSIVFFIDQHSNWYTAGGIYINGWAVVPPQEGDF